MGGRFLYAYRQAIVDSVVVKRKSQCPSPSCSAANPRQRAVDAGRLSAADVTGDWISSAMQCDYCDDIYSVELGGGKIPRGHFEGGLILPGKWKPYDRA